MMPGTCMMSSWKRAALRRWICSFSRHENLAALMAALLHAGLLVFDVIAGHAHFHESANQIAHVSVAAVTGVGVGDDEWPIVDFRTLRALFRRHA